jgi:hypothetical protein
MLTTEVRTARVEAQARVGLDDSVSPRVEIRAVAMKLCLAAKSRARLSAHATSRTFDDHDEMVPRSQAHTTCSLICILPLGFVPTYGIIAHGEKEGDVEMGMQVLFRFRANLLRWRTLHRTMVSVTPLLCMAVGQCTLHGCLYV